MLRIRASALYLVIVIALAIGIFCSSLIVVAYYYQAEYHKKERYALLQSNLHSAINILLAGEDTSYAEKTLSLFQSAHDSVKIKRLFWGVYDAGVAQAFINGDTLYKTFSIAHETDSSKWCALYLADNRRPLGLSGKTNVRGDVFIPQAGFYQAYVDGQSYTGDPKLISGKRQNSRQDIPALNKACLEQFRSLFRSRDSINRPSSFKKDNIDRSFRKVSLIIDFKHVPVTISGLKISGNIILLSDTTVIIDSTTALQHIIIVAKSIVVKDGFVGSCQLFASDSVNIGRRCRLSYPSAIGVLRFGSTQVILPQAKISINDHSAIDGCIFLYQEQKTDKDALLIVGRSVLIKGEVYVPGYSKFISYAEIDGALFTRKLLYQTSYSYYEGYLVNVTLDEHALSPYFLQGNLLPIKGPKKKILEWIETN